MKTMGMTKIASPRFCKHSTIPCLCWIEATLLHDDADAWDDADDDDCDDEADEDNIRMIVVDVLQVCHRHWNSGLSLEHIRYGDYDDDNGDDDLGMLLRRR